MRIIFIEFMIYSLFGYVLECIYSSVIEKRINFDRGFMMGPYCPIYGITILCINKITKFVPQYMYKVILAGLLIAVIEYATGFILEKIFNRTWWDYSRKKYNIKGRVCLENVIVFSVGAIYIITKISPILYTLISSSLTNATILSFFLFIIFIIDLLLSIKKNYIDIS